MNFNCYISINLPFLCRLRQHKMHNGGKNYPLIQSLKPMFNENPLGALDNDMSEPPRINYDSNSENGLFESDIDDGIWGNAKWNN